MESWHKEREGYNFRYYHETLLNYGLNRWGLNKASSIGKTSELIRCCSPADYSEWIKYYFDNAKQNKKDGLLITEEYLNELGDILYTKLSEVVSSELETITQEECRDYVYNLVINRTYEGYLTEIKTVYGILQKELNVAIKPAPDEWDRNEYSVDFYIEIKPDIYIGIQIKPVTGNTLNYYQWEEMHRRNHNRFTNRFKGQVFFVYARKAGDSKEIVNGEVIELIRQNITDLSTMA